MGMFSSKIAVGIIAGGFTLAGAGLLFTGSDTLKDVKEFALDTSTKLVQFENNENALVNKFNLLKENANSKIETANASIVDLKAQKAELQSSIEQLNDQVADLTNQVELLKADIEAQQNISAELQAKYDAKVAELNVAKADLEKANKEISNLNGVLAYAEQKAGEADKLVAELEAEVQKANKEVAETGETVDQAKEESKDAEPLSQEEIDALDTDLADIQE